MMQSLLGKCEPSDSDSLKIYASSNYCWLLGGIRDTEIVLSGFQNNERSQTRFLTEMEAVAEFLYNYFQIRLFPRKSTKKGQFDSQVNLH